jgi:hypothetical protein
MAVRKPVPGDLFAGDEEDGFGRSGHG